MLNTCVPVFLASKPAIHLAARVVQRVARRVVGHGRRPSNAAVQAKLAAPKAVHAPAVCVKGAGLAAMKAAAVAGWLGTAGAAGYAAADVAAGEAPPAASGTAPTAGGTMPGLVSNFMTAAVGPTATARPTAVSAMPFALAMRAGQAPSEPGASAAPENAAQPAAPAVSDAFAPFAPGERRAGESPRSDPLPASVPRPPVPGALPLSAPTATHVAEPGSLVLLAAGLLCSAALRARSRRRT